MGFGTELLFVVALGLVVLETLRRSLGHAKMSATLELRAAHHPSERDDYGTIKNGRNDG